nr:MAG TPA: Thermolysin metallopeptidase, catalytic domain [Caudoviricetes sp.]
MKKVKVDVYRYEFFVSPCADEVAAKCKRITGYQPDSDDFSANAFVVFGKGTCLVWMPPTASINTVAHEATHVAMNLMRDCGIAPDLHNQEVMAYLIGYIVGEINRARNAQ